MHFVIWKDGGMNTVAYRRNGLTAVVAADAGSFTTRAFTMPANGITLNADASDGWIEAQLLDESGKPLDSVRARVGQTDKENIPLNLSEETIKKFAGHACKLRISLQNARLYSIGA